MSFAKERRRLRIGSHNVPIAVSRTGGAGRQKSGMTEKVYGAVRDLKVACTPSVRRKTGLDTYSVNTTLVHLFKQGRLVRKGTMIGAHGRLMHIYAIAEPAHG